LKKKIILSVWRLFKEIEMMRDKKLNNEKPIFLSVLRESRVGAL